MQGVPKGQRLNEAGMKQQIGEIACRVARRLGVDKRVTWSSAQSFELENAIAFMKGPDFKAAVASLDDPTCLMSAGYLEPGLLREFFGGDANAYRQFVQYIGGKAVMDIGPCVCTPLSLWDVADRRIVIEPLYDQVVDHTTRMEGVNYFKRVDRAYSYSAERRIPELIGSIDGAIVVRNCIDHSPSWPFILSNIAAYAAPGAYLLLWNDLLHPKEYLDGHFDITDDSSAFRTLLMQLGFDILYEFDLPQQGLLNYGCRAVRRG